MRIALLVVLSLIAGCVYADAGSPVGLWRSVDDKTGRQRALIRIVENNGVYEGRIEKIFSQSDDDPQHLCRKCEGARKDQPIVGMTVLWGMHRDGDSYTGGELLDPHNGKTYSAKMTLLDGGKKLDVRGFIGFSLIGRSQIWVRDE